MGRTTADLHTHTTASDGSDSVDDRVRQAREQGIDCIAVTDHDTMTTELTDRVDVREGIEVIAGAEIKAGLDGDKIEVLGYLLDPSDDRLQEVFETIARYRRQRMEEMVERVTEMIDGSIAYEDVAAHADGTIARPHIAQVLVERGVVDSVGAAFDRYIGEDRDGYVETEKMDAAEVIDVIHQNGGVASLAHPGRSLDPDRSDAQVTELVDAGLDAIEAPYTYDRLDEDRYAFGAARAMELATDHGLLVTGGSDCHGSDSGKFYLGDVRLPYRHVEALKDRCERYG